VGYGAKPQPTNDLVHIGVKKCSSGDSSFCLFSFLRTNVLFCAETSLTSYGGSNSGRRPTRSFSPGAVATIAPWKSAPMAAAASGARRHGDVARCHAEMTTDEQNAVRTPTDSRACRPGVSARSHVARRRRRRRRSLNSRVKM